MKKKQRRLSEWNRPVTSVIWAYSACSSYSGHQLSPHGQTQGSCFCPQLTHFSATFGIVDFFLLETLLFWLGRVAFFLPWSLLCLLSALLMMVCFHACPGPSSLSELFPQEHIHPHPGAQSAAQPAAQPSFEFLTHISNCLPYSAVTNISISVSQTPLGQHVLKWTCYTHC